jgi:uncharacterized OB-fold protein
LDTTTPIWSDDPPRLLASRHAATGTLRFPPLPAGSPLHAAHETVALASAGRVYSFTVIHPNPKSGATPFALGYVDMDGPVRLFGRIDGAVAIDATCEAVRDADGGYRFQVQG